MNPYLLQPKSPKNQSLSLFSIEMGACHAVRCDSGSADAAIRHWVQRQIDLINAAYGTGAGQRLALRVIARPDAESPSSGRIEIALFGGTVAASREESARSARLWYRDILNLLGNAAPDYAWRAVETASRFGDLWRPFAVETAQVAEIRRREEIVALDTMRPKPTLGRGIPGASGSPALKHGKSVYVAKRFVPRLSTMRPLLGAMALHDHPSLFQVTLTPTVLIPEEIAALEGMIALCEEADWQERQPDAGLSRPARTLRGERARELGDFLRGQLSRWSDAPFLQQISLCSPQPIPETLLEAIGVDLTEPVASLRNSGYADTSLHFCGGGFDIAFPATDADREAARAVLETLAFSPWGPQAADPALKRFRHLMDAAECAGAFRLPLATAEGLPGLTVKLARRRGLPREMAANPRGRGALFLGVNDKSGVEEAVHLRERDRCQHVYVVGQTGTGKSTLLKSMALSDMENGHGLAVIDPHGDLFSELLALVPEHRQDDVVLFDPTDRDFPVGLNPLECIGEEDRFHTVRAMRSIIERLVIDAHGESARQWMGPLFFQHVEMNLLLVMSRRKQSGTLIEFHEIFQRKDFWKRWLPLEESDDQLRNWVEEVLPRTDFLKPGSESVSMGDYIRTKFHDFVFDPLLRNVFGQRRSTIRFDEIMNGGRILLVNLAKGELAEQNSRFLGMLLISQILGAALRRVRTRKDRRRPFHLYVDEFQSLATEAFSTLLSESRKFGVSLVLANQFMSQLVNDRITRAIFGNVGTTVAFRTGAEDAELLTPQFAPFFDTLDLRNLPNWEAAVRTTVEGQVVNPFTVQTRPPKREASPSRVRSIRQQSRERHAVPRAQAEAEIAESLKIER